MEDRARGGRRKKGRREEGNEKRGEIDGNFSLFFLFLSFFSLSLSLLFFFDFPTIKIARSVVEDSDRTYGLILVERKVGTNRTSYAFIIQSTTGVYLRTRKEVYKVLPY